MSSQPSIDPFIPKTQEEAENTFKASEDKDVSKMTREEFVRLHCAVAYLFPGYHPDDVESWDGPVLVKAIGAEAWCRHTAGELDDDELYPYEATKAGIEPVKGGAA